MEGGYGRGRGRGRGRGDGSQGGAQGGGGGGGRDSGGRGAGYGGTHGGGATHGGVGRGATHGGSGGFGRGSGGGNQHYQHHQQPRPQFQQHQQPRPQFQQQPRPQFQQHQQLPQQPRPFQQHQQQWPQQPPQYQQQQRQQHQYQQQQFQQQQRASGGSMGTGRRYSGEGSSSSNKQLAYVGDDFAVKLRECAKSVLDSVNRIASGKKSSESKGAYDRGDKVPIKRPENGSSQKERNVELLANHFHVEIDSKITIEHYDIDVKPDVTSTSASPVRIPKAILSLIIKNFFEKEEPDLIEKYGFDGKKNIYSAELLGLKPDKDYTVELSHEGDGRGSKYKLKIKHMDTLKLCTLNDNLGGNELPRQVLQGLDVVMKENFRRKMISIGKSFYEIKPKDPLGCGLVVPSDGFKQSLKPTSNGLALCLDYSVMAFHDSIDVLEYLSKLFRPLKFDNANGPNAFLGNRERIEKALVGLKVRVTHRSDESIYVVNGLTNESARDITFTVGTPDGEKPTRSVSLLEYFQEKYDKDYREKHKGKAVIEHENLPCLIFGKGKRVNYVPIELCKLVEGQRFPKDNLSKLDKQADHDLKDMSVLPPGQRKSKIDTMVKQKHGNLEGDIRKIFGIDVTRSMTTVKSGVLEPPRLKLRNLDGYVRAIDVVKEKCQWNLVKNLVVEGTSLKHWAVVVFNHWNSQVEDAVMYFVQNLVRRCKTLGLHMEDPLCTRWASMDELKTADSVTRVLEQVQREAHKTNESNLQLVLCVMARKVEGYRNIKWVSETKIGVLTQCCLFDKAKIGQDQYLANLGIKINAKLGGSTVELNDQPSLFGEAADHVMLIGADVNHPAPSDSKSKSVAAVVASMNWPAANKYIPRIRYQEHRLEEINGFGSICLELIKCYENINTVQPKKLVIFRDGVSEGQFDMVLNKELQDLKDELQKIDYHPTITLIVARKRHLTRLFPAGTKINDKNNIRPGTVVDTDIVHPSEFDFYLCSHYGSIGTSKPTHYHVLWDEHKLSPEKLQQFIYHLCFTFAKCSKPVSLVPPIYYADRLAFRGRTYYEAQPHSGETPSVQNPAHSHIKNFMYFI